MDNFEFMIPKEALDKIKDPEMLKRSIEEGKSLQEIFGYNDETMEKFYSGAYSLFQQRLYQDAAHAFVFLTILNPFVANYWLGLGMSEQLIEEYETALTSYAMAAMLKPTSPTSYFHSATCLFALNEKERALAALEMAIRMAGDLMEYDDIKKRAQLMFDAKKDQK